MEFIGISLKNKTTNYWYSVASMFHRDGRRITPNDMPTAIYPDCTIRMMKKGFSEYIDDYLEDRDLKRELKKRIRNTYNQYEIMILLSDILFGDEIESNSDSEEE